MTEDRESTQRRLEIICTALLETLGEDPKREGLLLTPTRWAKWWMEFTNYDPGNTETTFESISTDQINVVGEVDKIRNHLRYAQSMAMKRSEIWGFKSDGLSPGRYWIFTGDDPDNASNQVSLPGETEVTVSLPDSITMTSFTIFFDKYGKPYNAYTDEFNNTPLSSGLTITVSGPPNNLTITPETGLITTQ